MGSVKLLRTEAIVIGILDATIEVVVFIIGLGVVLAARRRRRA